MNFFEFVCFCFGLIFILVLAVWAVVELLTRISQKVSRWNQFVDWIDDLHDVKRKQRMLIAQVEELRRRVDPCGEQDEDDSWDDYEAVMEDDGWKELE